MILLTAKEKSTPLCWGAFGGDAPGSQKTSLVVRDVFDGDETQRKKKALLFIGSAFDGDAPSSKKHPSL